MSSLNTDQKRAVAGWVNEGLSLSAVQKRIAADFGIAMTYMEVRFLVDDLDLTLKNKEEPKPAEPPADAALPGDVVDPGVPPADVAPEPPAPGASRLTLTVDPIQRPGVLVGGTVTFSDGKNGQWQMDQYGQLGFVPPEPGYKPSADDVARFQVVLDTELRKLGY